MYLTTCRREPALVSPLLGSAGPVKGQEGPRLSPSPPQFYTVYTEVVTSLFRANDVFNQLSDALDGMEESEI